MSKIAGYKVHPVADVFPLIDGDEFAALVADIKQNGQREPVTMYQGMLLDGRNRARACQRARVKLRTRNWTGKDPVQYVVSLNIARRHLDESQRAMVAARLATLAKGRPAKNAPNGAFSQTDAAGMLNVSRREVQRARNVIDHAEPELVAAVEKGHIAVAAAAKVAKRSKREQQRVAREASKGTPASQVIRELNRKDREKKMRSISRGNKSMKADERYGIILADPSWMYEEGTTTPNRRIDNHYPPMSLDEICALPVRKLGLPNSILYLWIPGPLLFEAGPSVLEAWDYRFKSQWIWEKEGKKKRDGSIGGYRATGYWAITNHEHVLICTRGDVPPPPPKARFSSVFRAPVGSHSEKPPEVHRRIEKAYPNASKIELFARSSRKGWSVWGNQSEQESVRV